MSRKYNPHTDELVVRGDGIVRAVPKKRTVQYPYVNHQDPTDTVIAKFFRGEPVDLDAFTSAVEAWNEWAKRRRSGQV